MSDRPDVTLHLRREDLALFRQVTGFDEPQAISAHANDPVPVEYFFEECKYGHVGIEDLLKTHAIPYDKHEDGSYEHGDHHEHLRFDSQGNPVLLHYFDEDKTIPAEELHTALEEHPKPEEAVKRVRELLDDVRRRTVPDALG